MPPKSDPAHFLPLAPLQFLASRPMRIDFSVAGSSIEFHIESHAPGVFRLRVGPSALLNNEKPAARARSHAEMLLARQEAVSEVTVSSLAHGEATGWRLEQGDITVDVCPEPLSLVICRNGEPIVDTGPAALVACDSLDTPRQWQWAWALDVDDALHGGQESGADLDRRGAQFCSDDPQARALPLVWSTRGWGVYFNTFSRVCHDLGAGDASAYAARVDDPVLDVFLFVGEPPEILNQYTALTGRAGQPGLWPMGVWLDQPPGQPVSETLNVVRKFRSNGWALDAVRLAAPAAVRFQDDKPVFDWDAGRFSDARELIAGFSSENIQLAAPTFPGVLKGTGLFDEWEDRGWLLINDDGEAHVFPGDEYTAGREFGLLDLTNKDVYKLWSDRLRQLADDGLGAPVCRARFDIPDSVTARSGESGPALRTIYPVLARRALFDAFAGHKTPQEGVLLGDDLFPSMQRYAWQLGPCTGNDWADFEHSLRMALSLGDAGVPVQMHTLGSARHDTSAMTPELYIRWLAACVFSGNFSFQGHAALLPDAFADKTRRLVDHWLQWRYRLIPYVLGIIEDAVRTGLPVQRSMGLAFPHDPMAQAWDTQYMFGPAVLVAPVLHPGTETQVYLPEGSGWWDMNTGWRYDGGTTLTVQADLDTLPVFGREGHMLCLGPAAQHTGDFNSARILEEVWMFGMPEHSPAVMRNKIRVMQMQGSSYIKGLEGLRILPSEGLEVKRRGAEVRISRAR
ncbi:MAG: glycoside hydrolase family 31 protein [Burkholderiaceae bacterium]